MFLVIECKLVILKTIKYIFHIVLCPYFLISPIFFLIMMSTAKLISLPPEWYVIWLLTYIQIRSNPHTISCSTPHVTALEQHLAAHNIKFSSRRLWQTGSKVLYRSTKIKII